ncbi:MAG: LysM peptidoglycan-binding domain-containing protein [Pseudonocardiaceae bacterium]|nr:MAG: LysM peptidoglycan-binding domain-containing protein [Pseudonocardiaceae bacterium]
MGKHNAPQYRAGRLRGRHAAPVSGVARAAGLGAAAMLVTGAVITPTPALADDADQVAKLKQLAQCESGGNATAKNPSSSASGYWQIIDGTWLANGGGEFAPTARQATLAEQNTVAIRISQTQGASAWTCAPAGLRSPFDPDDVAAATGVGGASAAETTKVDPVPAVREHAERAAAVVPRVGQAPREVAQVPLAPITADTYTVVPGDTLSGIALRAGHDGWSHLYEVNRNQVGDDPNLILPGQVLDVR